MSTVCLGSLEHVDSVTEPVAVFCYGQINTGRLSFLANSVKKLGKTSSVGPKSNSLTI